MLGNWIRQTTTTTGTGNLTLSSVSNYPTFNDVFGTNAYFYYTLVDDTTGAPLETGIGYLSASTTLVRSNILATYVSSVYDDTSPTAVSLAAGTKRVICSMSAGVPQQTMHGISAPSGGSASIYPTVSTPARGTLTLVADRLYVIPFFSLVNKEIESLKFRVMTAGAAGKLLRVGLYEMTPAGWAGNLIEASGTIAADSTGIKTFTLSATVRRKGWLCAAITSDGAPVIAAFTAGQLITPFGINGSLDSVGLYFKAIGTTLTMPNPMDVQSGFTDALVSTGFPMICPTYIP